MLGDVGHHGEGASVGPHLVDERGRNHASPDRRATPASKRRFEMHHGTGQPFGKSRLEGLAGLGDDELRCRPPHEVLAQHARERRVGEYHLPGSVDQRDAVERRLEQRVLREAT